MPGGRPPGIRVFSRGMSVGRTESKPVMPTIVRALARATTPTAVLGVPAAGGRRRRRARVCVDGGRTRRHAATAARLCDVARRSRRRRASPRGHADRADREEEVVARARDQTEILAVVACGQSEPRRTLLGARLSATRL